MEDWQKKAADLDVETIIEKVKLRALAYREAGYPLGETIRGLTIWTRFETKTTVN